MLIFFFFLNNQKSWALSQIKPFTDSWQSDTTQAKAPPTTIDEHRLALSELSSVRYCFDAGTGVDKNVS